MYVREYMQTSVITISPQTLLPDAEKIMRDHKIRRLPVMNKGKLVGLITEKDIVEARPSPATSLSRWEITYLLSKLEVKQIMVKAKDLITVTPDTTIEDAISLGHERHVGALPVVDNGKLIGIITVSDLFKITAQALGFGTKGMRLHIYDCPSGRELRDIIEIILYHEENIQSLFLVLPPGTDRKDAIISLDTTNVSKIINDLRSRGFTVESREK